MSSMSAKKDKRGTTNGFDGIRGENTAKRLKPLQKNQPRLNKHNGCRSAPKVHRKCILLACFVGFVHYVQSVGFMQPKEYAVGFSRGHLNS